jgi:hypothetical protein
MTRFVALAIPRWQWRTFGHDLSWLGRRLSTLSRVEVRRVEETHLVCLHSAHHAWLCGGELELRWRTQVGAEGFELWDTILRAAAPFDAATLGRLFGAWGIAAPGVPDAGLDAAGMLAGPVAATSAIRPVAVERRCRTAVVDGIACTCETISTGPAPVVESFAIEHEDPALMAQLLAELGLEARANTGFLKGLKQTLGIALSESEGQAWARKSNASSS